MTKKVLKFGGTSVGSIQRIVHAAKIVKKEHDSGNKIIVVVSAMAGTTNEITWDVTVRSYSGNTNVYVNRQQLIQDQDSNYDGPAQDCGSPGRGYSKMCFSVVSVFLSFKDN